MIPEVQQRFPSIAADFVDHLLHPATAPLPLAEAARAREHLTSAGYAGCPTWTALQAGVRPPQERDSESEPGEFAHGWQFYAASRIETTHRDRCLRLASPASSAMLRSQSGPGSACHLIAIPTCSDLEVDNSVFGGFLLRRLRLPLPFTSSRCNGRTCRDTLDPFGDHRTSCSRSGRLQRRAIPIERMLARVFREAGARVRTNVLVRDLNAAGPDLRDHRQIEVIAEGLPLYHGRQLVIDATLVSPLTAAGLPAHGSHLRDGAAIDQAVRRKHRTYADLLNQHRCRLVVAAIETGGRWSKEWYRVLLHAARAKARSATPAVRRSAEAVWFRRWTGMFSVACQRSLLCSLLHDVFEPTVADGATPALSELF